MKTFETETICPEIGYFVHRKCLPSWKMERTIIGFIDLTYIVYGEVEYTINGVCQKAVAGDLICIPKGRIRQAVTFPEKLMNCYSVNFLLHDFSGADITLPFPIVYHIGIQSDIISLYERLKKEWVCRTPGYHVKTAGIFMLILHRYMELIIYKNNLEEIDARIKKVVDYIANHYDENLQINKFAKQFDVSPMYFGLLFKHSMGISFHQYIMEIRLNNAEAMLRSGEYTVAETALSCGFKDAFYFSKVFKKNRYVSPSKLIVTNSTPPFPPAYNPPPKTT